ncbi:MAG TPA: hypothetical protein VFX48_03870 [Saprospiraceae bacterium]|nr:hypothetical protein [Saprospiraceae bacterium]
MLRISILLLLPLVLSGQSDLAIGNWATHLPYNRGLQVTQSDRFVYYATDFSVLQIEKDSRSIQRFSRTEGLSDSRINTLHFHQPASTLVIAYENGVLDLVTENGVHPVVDILNFNNIPIDKFINRVSTTDNDHVFISANYGLSLLNLRSATFTFTLFTPNIKVFDCTKLGNRYFMTTENGVYLFEETGVGTIQNFGSWKKLGSAEGLPANSGYFAAVQFAGTVFVAHAKGVYRWTGQAFETVLNFTVDELRFLSAGPFHLMAGLECLSGCQDQLVFLDDQLNETRSAPGCGEGNRYAVESSDSMIWYADERWSFHYSDRAGDPCKSLWVSGPLTNNCFEIAALQDGIYVATGGVDATFTPKYSGDGILKYSNRTWSAINSSSTPDLQGLNITDVIRIAEHPNKTKIYYGSAGKGLIEYDRATDRYKVYNKTNSPLLATVGDTGNVRISGLAFDFENTLWITNYLAPVGLVSLNAKGEWKNYIFPNNSNLFSELKIDRNGYKWIISRLSGGVMVFDEGDPDNPSDDRSIQLNESNTEMTTNDVRTVEVDLDGDVWVGTSEGPVVFECGSSIFSGTCKGSRRKVDQDGIVYFLLSSEVITTIAVDGANRKWFGTSNNGIYVQSPGGELQIHNFNTGNSPLLDNNILDIAIDPQTGEAWIATGRGLQVFRSDATTAKDFFTETPLVFPNPVPYDYSGPIAIKGLARDARVKITDISGRLVYETLANGGQAIWDGRDYLGRKAVSGVYLVFANTTQDFESSEGLVTKIVLSR